MLKSGPNAFWSSGYLNAIPVVSIVSMSRDELIIQNIIQLNNVFVSVTLNV